MNRKSELQDMGHSGLSTQRKHINYFGSRRKENDNYYITSTANCQFYFQALDCTVKGINERFDQNHC